VAWEDYRNGQRDIFAQRVLANGALDPAWPAAGRAISSIYAADLASTVMAVDGSGGALIAWAQGSGTREVHVHHVLASGAMDPAWPSSGRALNAGSYDQGSPMIVSDGAGGAIVSWDDLRNNGTVFGNGVYAQHVLATGALDPAWPSQSRELSFHEGNRVNYLFPRMVSDGAGGGIVTWRDDRDDVGDIYAQHVTSTGAVDPAWPSSGRAICKASRLQILSAIVANGAGGAVIAWQDQRANAGPNGEDEDVYAQGVDVNGQIGENPVGVSDEVRLALALDPPFPNPNRRGAITVRFTLPSAAAASLELLDVAGRRIAAHHVGSLGPGHHVIDLASGLRPRSGMYFVRLRQGYGARVQPIVILDE
jgi:hypothetical protein